MASGGQPSAKHKRVQRRAHVGAAGGAPLVDARPSDTPPPNAPAPRLGMFFPGSFTSMQFLSP